jgi:hypothetical protein
MEGEKIIARIVNNFAARDDLEERAMWHLKYTFMRYERQWEGLGFCLSEKGDLLSQWRGYAEDATGAAIGFSYDSILKWVNNEKKHQVSLEKIEYDPVVQRSLAESIYQQILRHIHTHPAMPFNKKMANLAPEDYESQRCTDEIMMAKYGLDLGGIDYTSFRLKLPAFEEEQEWRLLNLSERGGADYLYRSRLTALVPYLTLDFNELGPFITEVILGPKHETPVYIVEKFMRQKGHSARVSPSEASYQ